MKIEDVFLYPATVLENIAYNTNSPLKNAFAKEIVARITAIVAPILWICQFLVWEAIGILSKFSLINCEKNIQNVAGLAAKTFFSSLLEIPQKIIFGPFEPSNYFGHEARYRVIL